MTDKGQRRRQDCATDLRLPRAHARLSDLAFGWL